MKKSVLIREKIENVWHLDARAWQVFHAEKWLGEYADQLRRELGVIIVSHTDRGELENHHLWQAVIQIPQAANLAALAACQSAIADDPGLPAARKVLAPLYQELAAALAAEQQEFEALQAEAVRLDAERNEIEEKAKAAADQVRGGSLAKIHAAAAAVTAKLRELQAR